MKKIPKLKQFIGYHAEVDSIEENPDTREIIAKCTLWVPKKDPCILGPNHNYIPTQKKGKKK